MAADANLFQQYLKPVRSVGEYAGDMDARESNQLALAGQRRQNELAGLQMEQTRAGIADAALTRNQLQKVMSGWSADTKLPERISTLRASRSPELWKQADALQVKQADELKSQADVENQRGKTAKDAIETKAKAAEYHGQGLAFVQTPEQAAAWIDAAYTQGFRTAQEAAASKAILQQGGLQKWLPLAQKGSVSMTEQFKRDAEMQRAQLSADTQIKTTGMTNATSRANNAASIAQQERGSVRVDARSKTEGTENRKPSQIQIVEGPKGFEAVDKMTGRSVPVQGAGGEQVMGKRGQATAKAAQDAKDASALVDQAEKLVAGSTGSGMGAAVDSAAGFFGQATSGAKKVAQLKAIEGALLSKMPRMEGPQSDRDVALYRDAAGQLGNPNIPNDLKKDAIKAIKEIQQRYMDRAPPKMPTGGEADRPDPVADALKKYGG